MRVAVFLVVVAAAATSPATHNDCSCRWLAEGKVALSGSNKTAVMHM